MTRRTYKNPPIVEALCEFRFAPSSEWNLTIPGRLHDEFKTEFPGQPQQEKLTTANIVLVPPGDAPPAFSLQQGFGRVRFPTSDGKALLAVGPDVLSVHVLSPYPGWEAFRPRIEFALAAYAKVARPVGVSSVGIRYINRIDVGKPSVPLSQLFTCVPKELVEEARELTAFLRRDEWRYDDGVKLILTFANIPPQDDCAAVLVDLDVIWAGETPRPVDGTLELVDLLRHRERSAFEALISEDLRRQFDGD